MGKNRDSGASRANRIRFVMLEADLSDGNLTELTSAITTALRSPPQPARIAAPTNPLLTSAPVLGEPEEIIDADAGIDEVIASTYPTAPKTPRQYYKPKILKDVHLDAADKSFRDFVKDKNNPTETTKRYLVIAAWFHLHGGADTITADHVYTCYRSMDWVLDIKDVSQPFRDLKAQGWGDYKDRKFEINHVGVAQVRKMEAADVSA